MKQFDLMTGSGRRLPLIPCNLDKKPKIKQWQKLTEEYFSKLSDRCPPGEAVGVLCGQKSGIIVFDLDRKNGKDGVAEWEDRFGPLPGTAIVGTPTGGLHLYFKNNDEINKSLVGFLDGIDIRAGDTGFVLLPPSPGYRWITPSETEIIPVPAVVLAEYKRRCGNEAVHIQTPSEPAQPGEKQSSTPHGRAVLYQECQVLADTPEGARNDTLNCTAFEIGKLIKAGKVSEDNAHRGLFTAAYKAGLPEDEIIRTLESGLTAGMEAGCPQGLQYTQQAFAMEVLSRMGGRFMYLVQRKRWARYQNGIWVLGPPVSDEMALGFVMATADDLGRTFISDDDKEGPKWITRCHSANYQSGAVKQVKARLACDHLFDQTPIICFPASCYDPATQSFLLHHPEHYCSRHMGVDPATSGELAKGAPRFAAFLEQVTQGDKELQRYIQCLLGYCMTRDQVDPALFVWYGHGANGKTVLANIFRCVLGGCERGYCGELSQDDITMTGSERIRENLAGLESARVAFCPETEGGRYLKESLIKQITGGEVLTVEKKFGHAYSIRPCAKVVIYTNKPLRISSSDHGIWRRIAQVPFNYTVPDEDRNPDMLKAEYWQDELPAIAAWGLEGLQIFLDAGKRMPACRAVESTTQAYRMDEDHVGRFIVERLDLTAPAYSPAKDIHEEYKVWAQREEIEKPLARRCFYGALEEHGLTLIEKRKVKHIIGKLVYEESR